MERRSRGNGWQVTAINMDLRSGTQRRKKILQGILMSHGIFVMLARIWQKRLYKKKLTLEEYYQTTTVDKKVKPEDQVKDTDTGAPKEPQMTSAPTPNPSYKPKKTPKPSKSHAPTKSAKPKKTKAPKRTHAPKPKKTKKPTVTKAPVKTPAATKAPVPTKAPTKEPTKAPEETKVPSGDEMNE